MTAVPRGVRVLLHPDERWPTMKADRPYQPLLGHSWERLVPQPLLDDLRAAHAALKQAEGHIIAYLAETGQEPVQGFEGEQKK